MSSLRYSWGSYKRWLKRMYSMNSNNIKIPPIKQHEKTQTQLSELREDFNKLQSETRETIKKRDMK
jgi:hypothetical protein